MKRDEGTAALGGNAEADLKRRIDRRVEIAGELAEIKDRLAGFKKEDKDDGYSEKAISHAVKMRAADPEKVLATLLHEAECKVYRRVAGVPTEIEEAEKQVRQHVEDVPKAKQKRDRRGGMN